MTSSGERPALPQPPADSAPLRRNREFRALWLGGALSELGARAAGLATPLLVLAVTGSPLIAGSIGAIRLGAFVLCALPGGAVADRWDRRRAMLAAEILRATAATGLAAAVLAGVASVPIFVVVGVADALGMAVFGPAQAAALRHIVPREQLAAASARNEARGFVAELAGPPLGGVLFGLARWLPYVADAASYLASLLAVARIRSRLQSERTRAEPETVGASLGAGLRFIRQQPFLRALLVIGPLLNVAITGLLFALVIVLRQRGLAPAGIGAVQASAMAGGLAGAVCAGWFLRQVRASTLIIAASWVTVAMVLALAVLPGTYLLAVPLFGLMVLGPAVNGAFFAHQVAVTPDGMLGRVDGATGMLSQALSPAGPLLAGVLIEFGGGRVAFLGLAALLALASIIATASRSIRLMHASEPAA